MATRLGTPIQPLCLATTFVYCFHGDSVYSACLSRRYKFSATGYDDAWCPADLNQMIMDFNGPMDVSSNTDLGDRTTEDSQVQEMERYSNWSDLQYEKRTWDPPEGNGVYLFIKFPETSAEYVAQTAVLSKRHALCSRGHFVGIARKVHPLSSGPPKHEALVVYMFESTEAARKFFVSDNRLKQPDFPPPSGLCEAWTVVKFLSTRDDEAFSTYMMVETHIRHSTYHSYKTNYVQPLAGLILEYGGQPFVVQSMGVQALRRHYTGENMIATVHLFRSERDVHAMMKDERFQRLRQIQEAMAVESTSVFTIDPRACP